MNSQFAIEGKVEIWRTRFARPLSRVELESACQLGWAEKLVETSNLVMDAGLEAVCALLGAGYGNPTVGGSPLSTANFDDATIFEMRVTDQISPTAPLAGDSALEGSTQYDWTVEGPPAATGLLTVTYPASGQIRFSGTIPAPDLDGVTLTEEGLFTKGGELVARTTFSQSKTLAFGLQFDHTISVARV